MWKWPKRRKLLALVQLNDIIQEVEKITSNIQEVINNSSTIMDYSRIYTGFPDEILLEIETKTD